MKTIVIMIMDHYKVKKDRSQECFVSVLKSHTSVKGKKASWYFDICLFPCYSDS